MTPTWGLSSFQSRFRAGDQPSKSEAMHHRAEELASGLPPLLVAADRVATTVAQGVHGRRRVGQGETFWQFRRYEHGDSADSIDWRQSAKSQAVYVRETEWEAAQSVWVWRDASKSMAFRSGKNHPDKAWRADIIALALGWLLVRGGERVALLGSGRPPRAGRAGVIELAALMAEYTSGSSLPRPEPLPRYARLVLIGDFLSDPDETAEAVSALAAHGVRGHLVQVLDPAELAFPYQGRLLFEGPEAEGQRLVGRAEDLRSDYRRLLSAHTQSLAEAVARFNWTFTRSVTDEPAEVSLLPLYLSLVRSVGSGFQDWR